MPAARRALHFHPLAIAGAGLLAGGGVRACCRWPTRVPFLTGIWTTVSLFGVAVDLSTVMAFDIGVYLVVVGALSSVALALEDREDG